MEKRNPRKTVRQSNNLEKVANKPRSVKEKIDENVNLTLNIRSDGDKSCCDKEVLGDFNYQLRGRNKNQTTTASQSSRRSMSGDILGPKKTNRAINHNKSVDEDEELVASLAMAKMKYDVQIDPNVEDRYTDKPLVLLEGAVAAPESPESRRERMEIVARAGRLNPINRHLNMGAVVNPPLVSPGTLVGFTPAGQRHEVDLNADRPTWFNSEYARRQFDDATSINVRRMLHDMETGYFLPDALDPNVERRYFAERELAERDAARYLDECTASSEHMDTAETSKDEQHWSLLETESKLIEINGFAAVRYQDFPSRVVNKLHEALSLNITPLMIKKNPCIVYTLEMLKALGDDGVRSAAGALLDKIKRLFDVPQSQNFNEHLLFEADMLRRRMTEMEGVSMMFLTEEPPTDTDTALSEVGELLVDDSSEDGSEEDGSVEDASAAHASAEEDNAVPATLASTLAYDSDEEMVFVPVEQGEHWVDIGSASSGRVHYLSDADTSYTEYEPDSDSDLELTQAEEEELEALVREEVEAELGSLILNGMLFHGYPGFVVLNYLEYI